MNPATIIAEALRSIPPKVRKALNLVYALVVVVVGVLALLEVDLDYAKVTAVLTVIGGYLGIQSGANVEKAPEDRMPRQRLRERE